MLIPIKSTSLVTIQFRNDKNTISGGPHNKNKISKHNVVRDILRSVLIKANACGAYLDAAPRNILKVMTATKQWVRPRIHILRQ